MSNFLVKDGDKAEWGLPEGYPWKEDNRTEYAILGEIEFMGSEEDGIMGYSVIVSEGFILGEKYSVIFDDKEYITTAVDVGGNTPVIGNTAIITGAEADNSFPFVMFTGGPPEKINLVIEIDFTDKATHSVEIYKLTETTHPISSDFLPLATPTAAGAMKQAAAVANVTAAPTAEEFNALLKSLRDAGILATE